MPKQMKLLYLTVVVLKLSCDSTGNYFNLDLNGYQPERYYKIEYRIQSGSGTDEEINQYYDEGFTFKVTL